MGYSPPRIDERWVAAYDVHGDEHDPSSVAAFRDFCDYFKPDVRIIGGDLYDFRWLRSSAGLGDQTSDVEPDINFGLEFSRWFKPTQFLWGNHEDRLRRELNAPMGADRALARGFLDDIMDAASDAQHFPYCRRRGVFQYADHKFIHGYCHGVGAVRKSALSYGNVIMGHIHADHSVSVERFDPTYGYSSGCLCNLDMDYLRPNIGSLVHSNGWRYGFRIGNRLAVYSARKIGDVWLYPTEMRGATDAA